MGTKRALISTDRKSALRPVAEKIARSMPDASINQIAKAIPAKLADLVDDPPLSVRDLDWDAIRAAWKSARPRTAPTPRKRLPAFAPQGSTLFGRSMLAALTRMRLRRS